MVFLSLLPAADAAQFYVLVVLSVTAASKKGSHKSSDYCWPAIAIAAQLLCLPVMDIFFRHSDSPPLLTEIFGTYSWIARHTKRYGNTLEKSAHPVLVVFPMSSLKQKKFVTFSLLLVQWGGKLRRRNRVIHSWDGSMLARLSCMAYVLANVVRCRTNRHRFRCWPGSNQHSVSQHMCSVETCFGKLLDKCYWDTSTAFQEINLFEFDTLGLFQYMLKTLFFDGK